MGALRIVVNDAMNELHGWVETGMRQRQKNATGGTMRSVTVNTAETSTFAQGTLSADGQWRFVGNGRGPGKMPPIQNIQTWINARGLDISAWAVAKKIGKEGSADFRAKNSNVFADAVDAWSRFTLPVVDERAAKIMEDAVVEVAVTNLKGNG